MQGGIIGTPESVGVDSSKLESTLQLVEQQIADGLHPGAQLFVACKGQVIIDAALGEAALGIPIGTDSVTRWASMVKPLTAAAIAQLMEEGKLELDDRVQKYIPQFANGKESCTVRHILTHTGGFPMRDINLRGLSMDEMVQRICEAPAEWEPGTSAAYHGMSGWAILGEIVHRVDGRPIETYLAENLFKPLGMQDTSLGLSDRRASELGSRLSLLFSTVKGGIPVLLPDEPNARRLPNPSGAGYGPSRELGKFYLALWNGGEWNDTRILKKETVSLFTATHRKNMGPPWGLGFFKSPGNGTDIELGRLSTVDAFGHVGAGVGVAFCEPSRELVVSYITNGRLTPPADACNRLSQVSDSLHAAFQ